MTVSAPYHHPVTRTVVVDRDQRQDFALQPTPCVLVVDDDYDTYGNAYDDQAYYTAALDGLEVGYEVRAVADDDDGPPLEVLRRYRGVIWLTGRDWDHTLTSADQDALTAYLEGGGRLFVSGQDIGWDIARYREPSFYRDYLHADYLRDTSGYHELAGADFLSGLAVTIEGGDGADNQRYPSDVGAVGDGVGLFRYPDGDWGAVGYADGTYRAVYFAFGFEAINAAADRQAVMARVLNYLAPCSAYNAFLSGARLRFGEPGETVTRTVTVANIGTLSDAYDLSLGLGTWTSTLPVTHSALLLPQERMGASLVVDIPLDATVGDSDQFTVGVTSVHSPAHTVHLVLRTAVGHRVYLPLVCKRWQSLDTKP
jgi:hypothetical protein